jgi:hypothetical protein
MYFTELGQKIKEEWRRSEFDSDWLPAIACETLLKEPPSAALDYLDVITWAESASALPQQARLDEAFGQPPLTVFWDDRFRIDVLFWHTATTGIHQHQFCGAFALLAGSSLHCRYEFNLERQLSEGLLLGSVELKHAELLKTDDAREIRGSSTLIHSLFHLDSPSVSVVVRTPNDARYAPEFEYKPPNLAIDPSNSNPAITKKMQLLRLLLRLKSPDYERMAKVALENSDQRLAFLILRQALVHHEDPDLFGRLLTVARERHGAEVDLLLPSLQEEWRRSFVITQRAQVVNPDHRFFLALLMNLPSRAAISKIISDRHPESDPLSLVEQWCKELSGLETIGIEFDQTIELLFGYLLRGHSVERILELLGERFSPEDVRKQQASITELCERIRAAEILHPLFR